MTDQQPLAIQKLWDWIKAEDSIHCPICNKRWQYPGVDTSKCEEHGYIDSRQTQLEDLCRTPVKLGAKGKRAIKLSELTEEQAKVALLTLENNYKKFLKEKLSSSVG